jgi:hypothetical protein
MELSPVQLAGEAGLFPLGQFDQRNGLTRSFADALNELRNPDLAEPPFLAMVRACVDGILAGSEDQSDHDTLHTDPVLKLLADRSPDENYMASQPTLSRFRRRLPFGYC